MGEELADIHERLARLEYAEERSQDDREDMKADIKSVKSDVSDIKAIVQQVKGGAKVAWVVYGIIGAVAAGFGWVISKLPLGALPR